MEKDDPLRIVRQTILESYRKTVEQTAPGISTDPEAMLGIIIADGSDLSWWRRDDHTAQVLASLLKPRYEFRGFIYDAESRDLDMPNGESVQLTRNEGVVFLPLIARAPNLVPYRALQTILGRPINYDKLADAEQVRVWISRLRKKIRDINLPPEIKFRQFRIIKTVNNAGYSFDPPALEPPAVDSSPLVV